MHQVPIIRTTRFVTAGSWPFPVLGSFEATNIRLSSISSRIGAIAEKMLDGNQNDHIHANAKTTKRTN